MAPTASTPILPFAIDEGDLPPHVTAHLGVTQSVDGTRPLLTYAMRRTYVLGKSRLELADEQLPIVFVPELDDGEEGLTSLTDDSDFLAPKAMTDVVVLGSAYAKAGSTEIFVAAAIGSLARRLRVRGQRRVEVRPDGAPRFTAAEAFESMPLGHRAAYGGYDEHARKLFGPPDYPSWKQPGDALGSTPKIRGHFAYPRNTAGAGYFVDVDRARADGALLPCVEDPGDELTPERFFVKDALSWMDAPIPGTLGWVHYVYWPRFARVMGPQMPHHPPSTPPREIALGCGSDLAAVAPLRPGSIHELGLQGASPGLFAKLRGDEPVILQNLHPERPEIRFELPRERPAISIKVPDVSKTFQPAARLQTVRIEPDGARSAHRELGGTRVSMTWCAAVPLLREPAEDWIERCKVTAEWRPG